MQINEGDDVTVAGKVLRITETRGFRSVEIKTGQGDRFWVGVEDIKTVRPIKKAGGGENGRRMERKGNQRMAAR